VGDVGRLDGEIAEAATPRFPFDEGALARRVRDADDGAAREALGEFEAQRAPAAAQFEDAHAVGDAGVRDGAIEGRHFGLAERGDAVAPPGAAVFEPRAEHALEECGRHFVVLGVGQRRHRGDVLPRQLADPGRGRLRVAGAGAVAAFVAQPPGTRLSDAPPQQRIRQPAGLGQPNRRVQRDHGRPSAGRSDRGGHGTKALVVRW
jgi:hypothetical protein